MFPDSHDLPAGLVKSFVGVGVAAASVGVVDAAVVGTEVGDWVAPAPQALATMASTASSESVPYR